MKLNVIHPKPLPPPEKTYSLEVTKQELVAIAFACGNCHKEKLDGSWIINSSKVNKQFIESDCSHVYATISAVIEGL